LELAESIHCYEREHLGELIHLDIKKLGRIGWDIASPVAILAPSIAILAPSIAIMASAGGLVHVCIASRIAFVQVMANQRKESAVTYLEAAVAYFAGLGVRVERGYRSKMFRAACKRLGLRQIFTRPYTPKTNGKAARFIQTALREWACAQAYQNSAQRTAELNWHRPYGSLKAKAPISRLGRE
jgi:hypothetical protein